MTPAHLASIRDRQNHGGAWSPREAQMKADIAELLAEVERLSVKPGKVARWGKGARYGSWAGCTVLRVNGRVVAAYSGTGITEPEVSVQFAGGLTTWPFATEPEARAHIEAEAVRRGWTVAK